MYHFVKEIMAIAGKESHAEGNFVFRLGEPADHFYILINGQVQLSLGDSDHVVYTSSDVGETFGPFPAGNVADPGFTAVVTTGQVFRFEVSTSTGGNTGAVEIRIFDAEA